MICSLKGLESITEALHDVKESRLPALRRDSSSLVIKQMTSSSALTRILTRLTRQCPTCEPLMWLHFSNYNGCCHSLGHPRHACAAISRTLLPSLAAYVTPLNHLYCTCICCVIEAHVVLQGWAPPRPYKPLSSSSMPVYMQDKARPGAVTWMIDFCLSPVI